MTIEAKIDRTNELLETLLMLFQQEGKAPAPAPEAKPVTDSELFGTEARQEEAKPKRKRRTKAEIAADEAAKEAQTPAKQAEAPTRDAVKMALIKFRDVRGVEAMKQLLLDFDAEALSQLSPEHYAGVIEKADALLNASTEGDDDDAF